MKADFTEELYRYSIAIAKAEHPVLQALRERTATVAENHMQITPDQGQFMAMLAKILGAQKYLEIGVYTGYSALAVTLAMDDKMAQTFALDIDPETMKIAKEYWAKANVESKIIPIMGDATASLAKLIDDGHINTFDIVFIDAEKSDYIEHFKYCYSLVRPGGIILVDNVFMHGGVLAPHLEEPALSVDKFNRFLQSLDVDYCVITIADGLTLVRKTV